MAEVRLLRLGSGAHRLAASFKSPPSRSLSGADGPTTETGSSAAWIIGVGTRGVTVAGRGGCEGQSPAAPVSRRDEEDSSCTEPGSENQVEERQFPSQETEDKAQRLSRPVQETRKVNWTLSSVWPSVTPCDVLLWDADATKPIPVIKPAAVQDSKLLHVPHSPFYPSPNTMQPLSHSLVSRMMCWSRGGVVMATSHPETGSPEQVRAFSTVVVCVSLAEQGSGLRTRLSRLKREAKAHARAYSGAGKGNNSPSDTPPLYRSKTAYYDILRVTPSATQSQIKTAYYSQSFIFHPDKNPDSEEATLRFGEISEAYSVLGSIGLRRKYDRGILSQSDVHGAGRPSSTGSTRASGPQQQQQQQQQQQRSRRFYVVEGKTMFDFDAFYQAHYGEQLQREREMRARKERLLKKQQEGYKKRKRGQMMTGTVGVLLTAGGVLFLSLFRC